MSPVAAQTWTANLKPFAETNTQMSTPMVVTADGSSYVCGDYDAEMIVGDYLLSPIANSAYIIKYTAAGSVAWALSLDGSVTINSTSVDAEGNLYVAGKLADKVVLNSLDNNSRTIEGAKADDGSYTVQQYNAFIAKYSAEGNLLAANTLDLKKSAAIKDAEEMEMGMSDLNSGAITVAAGTDKIYASILWKGSLGISGQTFDSPTFNAWGFLMMEAAEAAVFSFSPADLSLSGTVATIANTDDLAMLANEPNSICVTAALGSVYVGASATGFNTFTSGENKTNLGQSMVENEPHTDCFVIARIEEGTGFVYGVSELKQADNQVSLNTNTVDHMMVVGEMLYVAGTCFGENVFNSGKNAVGASDLYTLELGAKGNMIPQHVYLSNFDEGTAYNANTTENCNGLAMVNGKPFAFGYLYDSTYGAAKLLKGIGLTGVEEWKGYETDDILTAYATNGKYSTIATRAEGEVLAIKGYDTTTGIDSTKGDGCIRFVDNTVSSDAPADIEVYSANGSLVKAAQSVTSLSLEGLQNGLYIVKTAQGNVKVIKK